uniref:Uncharacterized protein n=1 Tax=Erythrolobus madagascarensis TaxID=708628 RepID=A0A7S0T7V3_9RHOD|mmetsp:Transcript_4208/g.9192  ORF Transcript_4208/g.9192 Transcript_4208/m.9192 type:complete len:229 (+) Transcript_4208:60-746(+)
MAAAFVGCGGGYVAVSVGGERKPAARSFWCERGDVMVRKREDVNAYSRRRRCSRGMIVVGSDAAAGSEQPEMTELDKALRAACKADDVEAVVNVLDNAPELLNKKNAKTGGSAPLHIAAYGDAVKVIVELVNRGAEVDIPNSDGISPLQFAATKGHVRAARALLQAGADDLHESDAKATAIDYAREWMHANMVEFLEAYAEAKQENGTAIFLRWLDDNEGLVSMFKPE